MANAALPADKFDPDTKFAFPKDPPSRVPLDKLAPLPGFNTRVKDEEYQAAVDGYADSMARHGFYENKPLAVVMLDGDDTIYFYDGEHRYDAARIATLNGLKLKDGVPVVFAPEGTTVRDLTISLVHANDGRKLNPVEMAAVVARLENMDLDKDQIAAEIGRTVRTVENLMVLGSANAATKRAVSSGKIAAAEATKLVRKHGAKDAGDKVEAAVKAAEAKGAKKATPKTMATGPRMKRVVIDTSLAAGDKMNDVLKAIATQIRKSVPVDSNDVLTEDGKASISLLVVDHEAEAAKAAKDKAAADKKAEAAKKKAAAPKKAPAKKTAAATKKAAEAKAPTKAKTSAPKKAPQKPAKSDSKASATKDAPKTDSKPTPATAASKDGNNGL